MSDVQWTVVESEGISTVGAASDAKKIAYVPAWASFNKLDEAEKAKRFNEMRGALVASGLMENRGA